MISELKSTKIWQSLFRTLELRRLQWNRMVCGTVSRNNIFFIHESTSYNCLCCMAKRLNVSSLRGGLITGVP